MPSGLALAAASSSAVIWPLSRICPSTMFRRTIAWFRNPENLRRYKTDLYNV